MGGEVVLAMLLIAAIGCALALSIMAHIRIDEIEKRLPENE